MKTHAPHQTNKTAQRILRPAATARYLDVSRTTLWRWVRDRRIPPPIRLGPNAVGFDLQDLDALIEARRAVLQ